MTEPIIIDGVDVAGCDYLFEYKNKKLCSITLKICNYHPTCYFKQLKRLEHENKEFKNVHSQLLEVIKSKDNLIEKYSKANYKYRQALEETRDIAKNSHSAPCLEYNCNCEHCKDECTNNGENCMEYGIKKILTKFNEALEDQEV